MGMSPGRRGSSSDRLQTLVLLALLVFLLSIFSNICAGQQQQSVKTNSIRSYYSQTRRREKCHVTSTLEERQAAADAVFSGTIREILEPPRGGGGAAGDQAYGAVVEIKRVLKGKELIQEVATRYTGRGRGRREEGDDVERYSVVVQGFGNETICDSIGRIHDTRVIMVSREGGGSRGGRAGEGGVVLRLCSSLVRMSLSNIEHTEAAISDKVYVPKPTVAEDPCQTWFCAFQAECAVNPNSGVPECRCIKTCPPEGVGSGGSVATGGGEVIGSVCGSDQNTYESECQLRMVSCKQEKRLVVTSLGVCGEVRNPCVGAGAKKCSFGAQCVPSHDGLVARCQCPESCASYGDSVGAGRVCGSDGKEYENECEMKKASCTGMKEISIKYYGKCDPCSGHRCEAPAVCQLGDARTPVCRCGGASSLCPMVFSPVCASDGRSYSSECVMRAEACRTRQQLRVIFNNDCTSVKNPCASQSCGPMEQCNISQSGEAECVCPASCEQIVKLVCGTDGKTYDNECELRRTACLARIVVHVGFVGECAASGPCRGYQCVEGTVCIVKNDRPSCVCPSCTEDVKPVCGSDGVSYNNECKLRAENCENKKQIKIKHVGLCNIVDSCEKKTCSFYSVCELTTDGAASCVCPTMCTLERKQVCGSDGVSYDNECQLKRASCQAQKNIIKATDGPCDACAGVKCSGSKKCESGRCICSSDCPSQTGDDESVCANNGVTYPNECSMRQAACVQDIELEIEHGGACEEEHSGSGEICDAASCQFGGSCTHNSMGFMSCNCSFNCDAVRSQVCGSDGKTYGSECLMKEASCLQQKDITVQPRDNCEDMEEEELCDGRAQLVNPSTRRPYDCNVGKETCPSGSYCHKLATAARCCKEEKAGAPSCLGTEHGCCSDGQTISLGPNQEGCPSFCNCHTLGSLRATCDPTSRQCPCKPGVSGMKCDRCDHKFWGLPKIAEGNPGCLPCGCDMRGSIRDDCNQMTGQCTCVPGATGQKCQDCINGNTLGPRGCLDDQDVDTDSCDELECDLETQSEQTVVCGSDGQAHGSECLLQLESCRQNTNIFVVSKGPCLQGSGESMEQKKTTQSTADQSPDYIIIGDSCEDDDDCTIDHAHCNADDKTCTCDEGYQQSDDAKFCNIIAVATKPPHTRKTIATAATTTTTATTITAATTSTATTTTTSKTIITTKTTTSAGIPSTRKIIPVSSPSTPTIPRTTAKTQTGSGAHGKHRALGDGSMDDSHPPTSRYTGQSYMQLKRPNTGVLQFTIDMIFLSRSTEGILFYSGQNNNERGDFISLSIKDGFLEFRYELGSGMAVLKSTDRLSLNRWHIVHAQRQGTDGLLQVDQNVISVSGKSKGSLTSLNLQLPIYIGFVLDITEQIAKNIGVKIGLQGCISSLNISSDKPTKVFNLNSLESADIEKTSQLGSDCPEKIPDSFSDPCDPNPCQSEGTCRKISGTEFQCDCLPGTTGAKCEQEIVDPNAVITVPAFDGKSFLGIPITRNVLKNLSYEIWLLATKPDGVILYASQFDGAVKGDFLSLNLVKGLVQLRYNLGSGIANITSSTILELNKWNKILIQRADRSASISINNVLTGSGNSGGLLTDLNLQKTIYVGGVQGDVHPQAGVKTNFSGAIQRLYESGRLRDDLVKGSTRRQGVAEYRGAPCGPKNPCMNDRGTCVPVLDEFLCRCAPSYSGKTCELSAGDQGDDNTDAPVMFDGHSFHVYRTNKSQAKANRISIEFRTRSRSGLLFLQDNTDISSTQSTTVIDDYLAIALHKGHIEVSFNLGQQTLQDLLILRSKVEVTDGRWHTLVFHRDKSTGHLSVDNEEPIIKKALPGAIQLNTNNWIWIGGSRNPPIGLPSSYYSSFTGCIARVAVDSKPVQLVMDRTNQDDPLRFCQRHN